jgi:CRISPR type III-A/MTUBE-associated protein Csm6
LIVYKEAKLTQKILFSPIGGTDPISNDRDGSMLHIARVYKPDKIVMFMSKEIFEFHEKDNRYCFCIEKLGEFIGHNFEIDMISEPELSEVQDYNYFYKRFRDIICDIYSGGEDDIVILLNTSSGTPAMKSALQVIATIAEHHYIPIQVATPERRMNKHKEDKNNYDAEYYWNNNFDNIEEYFENRCTEVECENLTVILKRDMIKKFILAYDYTAALMVADEIKDELSEDAYRLITAAAARLQLDKSGTDKTLKDSGYSIIPVRAGDRRDIVEYLLALEIKIKKGELADFIRGITPVTADMFEMILEHKCGIKTDDYCISGRWDNRKLEQDKQIYDILSQGYQDGFQGKNISSDHMLKLIEGLSSDKKLIQLSTDLRNVEVAVRNTAAHEIVSVTDNWLKIRTRNVRSGLTASEIFKILKDLCKYAGLPHDDEIWNSYDSMNSLIISKLQQ